jgi:hypothetical protein
MTSNRKFVLDKDELQIAERDEWVISVWTYQELANNQDRFFVAIDNADDHKNATTGVFSGLGVADSDFLSCIGYSLTRYTQRHNLTSFDVREIFPRLDILEDVIADRFIPSSSTSALQVMSNIDRRVCAIDGPENRFYAMIGVITQHHTPAYTSASSGLSPTIPDLAESFMRVCESKGDFSFIFSSAERDNAVGRRWRPKAGHIPSILPWNPYGIGQRGHYDEHGLWFDKVHCIDAFVSATLEEAARKRVLDWLGPGVSGSLIGDTDITNELGSRLKKTGFTGSSKSIMTSHGIFFPQTTIQPDASAQSEYIIIIPATLEWVFGYPALARINTNAVGGGNSIISFVAGVFGGCAPNIAPSSVLIDPTTHSSPS